MAVLFTANEINLVAMYLGYPEFDKVNETVKTALYAIEDRQRKDEIIRIIEQLQEIEEEILEVSRKSHLKRVDTVEFDYTERLRLLLREARRLLYLLSILTGVDILHNRFKGGCISKLAWFL